MTREEILNMPAGDGIDELIALHIFGETYPRGYHVPNYSTDISAAWDLVEQFYSMRLDKYSNGKEWRCYLVTEKNNKNVDASAHAETASLAICRAALLAVLGV